MRVRVPPFAPTNQDEMANVENLGTLERRVSMSLPAAEIEKQVDERLKKLARRRAHAGLPPGQGAAQAGGADLRPAGALRGAGRRGAEILQRRGAARRTSRSPAIRRSRRRTPASDALEFNATFEIYPEVKVGDLGATTRRAARARGRRRRGRQDGRDPAQAAHALRAGAARGARRRPPDGRFRRHHRRHAVRRRQGRELPVHAGRRPHAARSSSRRARHGAGRGEDVRAQLPRRTTMARKLLEKQPRSP